MHYEHGFPSSSQGAHIPNLVQWEHVLPHMNWIVYISKKYKTVEKCENIPVQVRALYLKLQGWFTPKVEIHIFFSFL